MRCWSTPVCPRRPTDSLLWQRFGLHDRQRLL